MKKQIFSFLLLISLVVSISAQKAQVSDALEQNLRKHIEYLASDKLEGRRTGEQGATYAAGYVANMFANNKLKGGVQSTKGKPNFLQPFPYIAGVTLGSDNFLRIVQADTSTENKMETGINWIPLGYSPNADIPASPVVFAGYGISSDDLKYDDYAGLDVRGKIVLIFDSTPDAGNPHSQFGRFNIHTKANLAKDKGARAIILIASDSDFKNDRLSRLSYDRTLGETAIPVAGLMRGHAAQLLGAKDEKELATIEEWLAKKTNAPPQAETRAVASVPSGRPEVNAVAQLKVNLIKKQVDAYNVIGILEGHDPVLKNEAIIIGAHYDHLGRGGQGSLAINSSDIHHGADDNASGTAAILELARQFAKEKKNKRTIIFMAFGGEEEGLLGSKYYVNNPVWPLDKTVAMINLDMVGRLNEDKLTVGGVGTASEWKGIIEARNLSENAALLLAKLNAPVKESADESIPLTRFILQLNEDGFGPSDHSSFYSKKIPVLFFFTGTHNDYHKPTDTFEKVNYEGLTQITNYVGDIARSIDRNPQKPTYAVAKSSGVMGGRTGFNVSLGTVPNYADSTDGLLLDGVRDGSPAAKAGLKPGDKVVKLAGKDVRNAMDYTYVLGSMKAGEEYEIVIKRGDETLTLKIVPAPSARRP